MTKDLSDIEEMWGYIVFSDTEVKEVSYTIVPDQERYKNEWLLFNYVKNEKLDFSLYAQKWDIDFKFVSTLDRNNNRFSSIDYTWVVDDYDVLKSSLTLKNKELKWNLSILDNDGDEFFKANLTWNTDSKNNLSKLDIDYSWNYDDYYAWETNFNWNIGYNEWEFSFSCNFNDDGTKFAMGVSWEWDSTNKVVTALKSNISSSSREWDYDYNSYKYIYSGDFVETFKSNIELKDKVISGTTKIKNYDNNEIISIEHSGSFEKNYLVLNNEFDINPKYNPLGIYSQQDDEETILTWDFNLTVDSRDNKNNANVYLDFKINEKKVIEFEIDNKSTIEYKDIEIKEPKDTVPIEDVIGGELYY